MTKKATIKKSKNETQTASYGQQQISDASHSFVFCSCQEVLPDCLNEFMVLKEWIPQLATNNLKSYGDFIKNTPDQKSKTELQNRMSR